MKVILREDLEGLGLCGDTIEVKSGYARNYLLPRNLAITATRGNLRAVDAVKQQKEMRDKKKRRGAEKVRAELEKLTLTTELVVGEGDQVFGSVTSHAIGDLIEAAGVSIDRRLIELDEPIKALGVFTIKIKVDKDLYAGVKLFVEKKAS